jgi:hypothetical protein
MTEVSGVMIGDLLAQLAAGSYNGGESFALTAGTLAIPGPDGLRVRGVPGGFIVRATLPSVSANGSVSGPQTEVVLTWPNATDSVPASARRIDRVIFAPACEIEAYCRAQFQRRERSAPATAQPDVHVAAQRRAAC